MNNLPKITASDAEWLTYLKSWAWHHELEDREVHIAVQGLETKVRDLEKDMISITTRASAIAAAVGVVVGAIVGVLHEVVAGLLK